jgi:zinc D-Ala-D-Ala carboxypeptidase
MLLLFAMTLGNLQKYWWVAILLILIVAFAAVKYLRDRDGVNANGIFDDDTEGGRSKSVSPTDTATYAEKQIPLRYFVISEFDSPDLKGSGVNMQISTLTMLNIAREFAGMPFHINSAYRTLAHNAKVGGVGDSAHTKGYAIDISAKDKATQVVILKALHKAGFRRFGVYATFIHADNDPSKSPISIWTGKGGVIHFNPLNQV